MKTWGLSLVPRHESDWVVEVWFQAFLNSAVGGDEWLASCPDSFTPGNLVEPTADLEAPLTASAGNRIPVV